ncbi:hypothetical protein FB45DRAFT_84194 [Roridomyces roridus]|uniref:Uncharacterized protein n=1 Tax=Roridomyces roridus TaxID=1738132 RepID=A0AAD7FHK5_9AGAR|nr:hypothetical protein FB45DRAFT_84194 [Roridomyces roridus]
MSIGYHTSRTNHELPHGTPPIPLADCSRHARREKRSRPSARPRFRAVRPLPAYPLPSPATLLTMATTPPPVAAPTVDVDIATSLLSSNSSTPAQLASLLATALADIESLRAELASTRAKADRAEHLLGTFRLALPQAPSTDDEPLPAATLALIASLDERVANAEAARDDASARLAVLSSSWSQLNSYLAVVEARAADARAGYERIVKEGGGRLVLGSSSTPYPPYMDGSRYERDSRKHGGMYAFQAGSSNPNGSVRPRESPDSYPYKKPRGEEYGGEYSTAPYPNPPAHQSTLPYPYPSHPHSHAHRQRSSSSASDDIDAILLAGSANGSTHHQPAAAQGRSPEERLVQGKKDVVAQGSPALPAAPAPIGAFPATNAANQRICRQCGLAGRYKEGKCVEKWGPGPLGPGTVCDRCRKKMKRVERRGTLEQQAAVAAPTSRAVHRTDTLPAPDPIREQENSMRSSLASPPPPPAVPAATHRRVINARMAGTPPGLLPPLRTHSPSPMVVDGDADGELNAEAEEAADGDDAEGDPEMDLLEAVDAAEANSNGSSSMNGGAAHGGKSEE